MRSDRHQHVEKRNITAFILQGIFYFVGFCFFDYNTVIPIFIESLTGKVEMAGIANTIGKAASPLFQLLFGSYFIKVANVPGYVSRIMTAGYTAPFIVLAALLAQLSGTPLAIVTFLAVAVMWVSDGFFIIGYYDLLGRTVSSANRGRVLGLQQLIGGVGAMAGAYAIKRILDLEGIALESKYMLIFLLGGIFLLLSSVSMFYTRDLPERKPQESYSLRKQLARIPDCIRTNKGFRRVMYCQIFFQISIMSAPYILIMSKNEFRLDPNVVSTLLNLQVLGTLLGGGVSAFLAPRFGNRVVVFIYCLLAAISGAAGLFTIFGFGFKLANLFVMVMASGLALASWAGFMNAIIDVSDEGNTHIYMVINSIVALPLSLSAVAGGYIIKGFGYGALMWVCVFSGVLAVFTAIKLYRTSI
jgi:MFS family permease